MTNTEATERVNHQTQRLREHESQERNRIAAETREQEASDRVYRWLRRQVEGRIFRSSAHLVVFALQRARVTLGDIPTDAQARRIGAACDRLWNCDPSFKAAARGAA